MRILEVRDIPLAIALKRLRESESKGLPVKGIARRTMELAMALVRCDEGEELYSKLLELGLSSLTASMVVDVAPKSLDELRILLNFEPTEVPEEVQSKVLELVSTYCK
jgi:DNA-directed RNA polymerase subunit F